jgi:hypothetical protein
VRQYSPDLCCSATNIMLCYTLAVHTVFTHVQNFVKNAEQLLFGFTTRVLREIACIRQKYLLSNILLIISGLEIRISNICPYFFCPGCTNVQQHKHCRNFIHFIISSSCLPVLWHHPLVNRTKIILQTGVVILQRTSRCVCTLKTNRCSFVKRIHVFL